MTETARAFEDPERLGRLLAASGYFADARDPAQATVKVLAGQELGFGPIASMTGIFIVKGRVTLSANLMAAAIKRHPRYDYRIVALTDDRAEIQFLERGEPSGSSEFTMDDAKRASLTGSENWRKYPRNMLLWRALSNGAKFFCLDASTATEIYTPDELGADVDPETGEIIATTPPDETPRAAEEATQPATEATPPTPARPAMASPQGASRPAAEPEIRPEDSPPPEDSAPADGPITAEELAKLREYLDALQVPESFWRMGCMAAGKSDLAELTKAEARDLMGRAKVRYQGKSS